LNSYVDFISRHLLTECYLLIKQIKIEHHHEKEAWYERTLAERDREVSSLKYKNRLLENDIAGCNAEIADLKKQLQSFTRR
jgi:predicted RNase H-like nuclease (RuvC/YqgF family)